MDTYSIALSGIRAAHVAVFEAAKVVASGRTEDYADAFMQLSWARHAQQANISVVRTQQEADRTLLDIFV